RGTVATGSRGTEARMRFWASSRGITVLDVTEAAAPFRLWSPKITVLRFPPFVPFVTFQGESTRRASNDAFSARSGRADAANVLDGGSCGAGRPTAGCRRSRPRRAPPVGRPGPGGALRPARRHQADVPPARPARAGRAGPRGADAGRRRPPRVAARPDRHPRPARRPAHGRRPLPPRRVVADLRPAAVGRHPAADRAADRPAQPARRAGRLRQPPPPLLPEAVG